MLNHQLHCLCLNWSRSVNQTPKEVQASSPTKQSSLLLIQMTTPAISLEIEVSLIQRMISALMKEEEINQGEAVDLMMHRMTAMIEGQTTTAKMIAERILTMIVKEATASIASLKQIAQEDELKKFSFTTLYFIIITLDV